MTAPDAAALRSLAERLDAASGPDRELDAALSAAFRVTDAASLGLDTSWHDRAIYAPMGESVVVALKTDDPRTTKVWCGRAQRLTGSPMMRAVVLAGIHALLARADAAPAANEP